MPAISLKSLSEQDAAASPAPRIGIVIAHLGSGGAEKAAVVLANGLADRGYFVDLLTWQAAAFHLKDMSPKVTRIDLSAGRRPNTTQVIASLVRYLLQKQPAIIFPHLEKPSLLVIAGGLLTGYRKIVPCIQIDLIAYAAIYHNRRHRLRRWLLICYGGRALSPNSPSCCRFGGRGANRTPAAVAVRAIHPSHLQWSRLSGACVQGATTGRGSVAAAEDGSSHRDVRPADTAESTRHFTARLCRIAPGDAGAAGDFGRRRRVRGSCWLLAFSSVWPQMYCCRELSQNQSPGLPKATYSFFRHAAKDKRWC